MLDILGDISQKVPQEGTGAHPGAGLLLPHWRDDVFQRLAPYVPRRFLTG
jgi:hypothetical protein